MSATTSIHKFTSDLRRLPKVVAQKVTVAAAPAITALAVKTFEASENPYGGAWAIGKDGDRVTLKDTGALEKNIRYVAVGTKLRVALGVPYAKFQVGKRPVFPTQGSPLPVDYARTLERVAVDVCRAEMGAR